MNIEYMEYILEIYRSKSINRAAQKLFVSQPRLSLVLKGIEDELGYKIFRRTNTGILPTEQGEEFIRSAEKIHLEFQKIKNAPERPYSSGSLSVSSCFSSLFSHLFFQFKHYHPVEAPMQDVFSETSHFPHNIQALMNKRNRIAVTYFNHKSRTVYEKYARQRGMTLYSLGCRFPVRAAVALDHPLTRKERVFLNDLKEYPFMTYYDVDYEVILGTLGFAPHDMLLQYVTCRASYYDALRINGCVSLSTDFAPGEAERVGCVCLPIEDASYNIPAYILPNDIVLNPREKAFIEFFEQNVHAFSSELE